MGEQISTLGDARMPAKILVVDDEPTMIDVLTRFLSREGYDASTAANGREALEKVRQDLPDLILLDIAMPELDGFTVCQRLKEDERTALIPIIMLSGLDDREHRTRGIEAGADDFLTKPLEQSILRARVRTLLRIKQLTDRLSQAQRDATRQVFVDATTDSSSSGAVAMHFDFPETVKVPCEQYLLYFVEFLRDIGIDATADLREDAGQVLFAVTPKDKDDALDNIREALEIYLRLPMNRNTAVVISPETSIEVQRLSAQLGFLQSQFYLASATLQQKELAIQQRDVVIQQQQNLITSGQVFIQALQEETKQDDTESVIGNIVKVKKLDWERVPIEVDLPTLLRWMKEKLGRKGLSGG